MKKGFDPLRVQYRQEGGKERQLLVDFAELHEDMGTWYLEVPVGMRAWREAAESDRGPDQFWNSRRIDAVLVLDPLPRHSTRRILKFYPRQYVSANMVDVFRHRKVVIVEAKAGRLDHAAIGQVNDYSALFEHDWEPGTVSKLVVCTAADVPLRTACERQGIDVAVVHYEDRELVEDVCPLCGE